MGKQAKYAEALRQIIVQTILSLSASGFQGSADKLEDAMDKADAIVGRGPYAKKKSR